MIAGMIRRRAERDMRRRSSGRSTTSQPAYVARAIARGDAHRAQLAAARDARTAAHLEVARHAQQVAADAAARRAAREAAR